jgi:23S rRNA (guanosine2251-2'-O)-methyltransferase
MVEPPGPDEEIVAGRRPVEEAFAARRNAFRLLVTPQRRAALERIVLHATSLRIPIIEVEGGTLTSLAGFDGHQGVALVVAARRYATLEDILARAIERDEPPFVLALDSLEDPQNVGTLLRSAEAAGVHGVIFPTHRQAPLTPAAVKASAGAVEHLLLVPVDDLPGALTDLHVRGLRVAGAEAEAPMTARDTDLRGPLVLVVGSEGQGLGPTVRRRCDLVVRIPMRGAIGSLNAAVAGSILLFEAVAQRDRGDVAVAPAVVGGRSRRPSWDDPGEQSEAAAGEGVATGPGGAIAQGEPAEATGGAGAAVETPEEATPGAAPNLGAATARAGIAGPMRKRSARGTKETTPADPTAASAHPTATPRKRTPRAATATLTPGSAAKTPRRRASQPDTASTVPPPSSKKKASKRVAVDEDTDLLPD